ncbi:hypothetical protein ACI2T3_08585 [Ralstonia nicotianae]|uniref:Uncharacterized protein n=1 Tax=Ralstonia solanacearum TaxID=305 RepID=A0A0S4V0W9_RALSL|nr:protein of unknown function [Ralstonia solanacearum]
MRAKIETSPTGFRYISVLEHVEWAHVPDRIQEILSSIGAKDIVAIAGDDATSVDTRWWNFTFKNGSFRIVYEDWPNGISIEPTNMQSASLLPEIEQLVLAT